MQARVKDREPLKVEGEIVGDKEPMNFNDLPENVRNYLEGLSKAALKNITKQAIGRKAAEDHKELKELAKKVEAQVAALNKELGKEYTLQDLYFKTRVIDYPKKGKYKVKGEVVEWSGKGKRPALLKGLTAKELQEAKID